MNINYKILFVIIKAIGAILMWNIGNHVTFFILYSTFNIALVMFSILFKFVICGLILHSNKWLRTIYTWVLSVLLFIVVWIPLMLNSSHIFFKMDLFHNTFDSIYSQSIYYMLGYTIPTLIFTVIVMLFANSYRKNVIGKSVDDDNKD
jgi:hypothetical protein